MIINGNSKIVGVGGYLPDQKISSTDLLIECKSNRFDIPHNFINDKLGIIERRFADQNMEPSDLANIAAEKALASANMQPNEIDLVVYCGITRNWEEPATAHSVQDFLGIDADCFDVSNACHGIVNGISIADSMIASGAINTALLVTGEMPSKLALYTVEQLKKCNDVKFFRDSIGALTAGDAGGAFVVTRSDTENKGLRGLNMYSQGKHAKLCHYKHLTNGAIAGQMLMKQINLAILKMHKTIVNKTYDLLNWHPKEVDRLICHQTGAKSHEQLTSILKVPFEKASQTVDYLGNLTSATLPINWWLHPPKSDEKVLLAFTGSGISVSQGGILV